MQGLLIDEEEYQVSPAISRYLTVLEVGTKKRQNKVSTKKDRPNFFDFKFNYESGTTGLTENYFYTADIKTKDLINVTSYSVFINGNYIGDDISTIQITNGDTLEITIVKTDVTIDAYIGTTIYLL